MVDRLVYAAAVLLIVAAGALAAILPLMLALAILVGALATG